MRTFVKGRGQLVVFVIFDGIGRIGAMLWFLGSNMTVFCGLFHEICWHSKIHMVFLVVHFNVIPQYRSPVQSSIISYVSLCSELYKC